MKLLCIADLHADGNIVDPILNLIKKEKIDVVLIAGDFCEEVYAQQFFERLEVKTFAVPGNWDDFDIKTYFITAKNWALEEYNGYYFFLVGNRIPRDFKKLAFDETKNIDSKRLIFLTHYPPYGVLDMAWSGFLAGIEDFRKFIDTKKPILHIFGHIHEAIGIEKVGETLAINCSIESNGRCYIVEVPELKVKEINLLGKR